MEPIALSFYDYLRAALTYDTSSVVSIHSSIKYK